MDEEEKERLREQLRQRREFFFRPPSPPEAARQIAAALLAGEWTSEALLTRLHQLIRKHRAWTRGFLKRLLRHAPEPLDSEKLIAFVAADAGFRKARQKHPLRAYWLEPAREKMSPQPIAATWNVPALCNEADLCAWLNLAPEKLSWLADVPGLEHHQNREALRNYYYRWIPKRHAGCRLLEAPKALLKSIQRKILAEILNRIPTHAAACGFKRGSGVLDHVEPHCNQDIVLRLDLQDFFLSIRASRVHAIFAAAGYPAPVARILTGLCTNTTPLSVAAQYPERMSPTLAQQLRTPHLPQGAPTSPALANLCAYKMDVRLTALAKRFDWYYTRYADDLLFSGPRNSQTFPRKLQIWAGAVALEESFCLNMRKTRILRRAGRQAAAGLILNARPNVPRKEYDHLKAILFNCAKHGPAEQNRANVPDFRAHLLGRIAHVNQIHPQHGAKLQTLFRNIAWA